MGTAFFLQLMKGSLDGRQASDKHCDTAKSHLQGAGLEGR